jgi:hypothetical protein
MCDDVVICNAAERIDWSDHSTQFELCEACLIEGCSPGGRVAIRRIGDRALVIPDFTAMCQSDCDAIEFAPPRWMLTKGCISLPPPGWAEFQSVCIGAPSFDSLAPASTAELLRLYHFQAPRAFLPDYLAPALANWDLILCTSGHDSKMDLVHLRRLFSDPSTFEGHDFCTPSPDRYTVSAFLDDPSLSEWPLFSSEPDPAVCISPDIHFRPKPRI